MSQTTFGTLYLLPTLLGETSTVDGVLPAQVQAQARLLRHFIAENAKSARAFLKTLGMPVPLQEIQVIELPRQLDPRTISELLAPLATGQDIGIVSEAGCPAIADPGALLVAAAHEQGIRVAPWVGPSSILLALMAAGLNGQQFAFNGYLPVEPGQRAQRLRELEKRARQEQQTQVFIETPYRNQALFEAMLQHGSPTTRLCLAIDLTLPGETIQTKRLSDWKKSGPPDFHKRPTIFCFLAS